jgi:hypothetical protein
MTQIERILYESSLISDAFKKMMWKTGQISLDAIYSAPKLAELHEDIFPQLVDQFLNFSRIKIRIKNFERKSFNIVLVFKETALWEIQKLLEKLPKYTTVLGSFKITKETLDTYEREINDNNKKKIQEYIKSHPNKDAKTIIDEMETEIENIKPYKVHEVDLSYLDLFRKYMHDWRNYFLSLIKSTISETEEQERIAAEKKALLYTTIEDEKLYFDTKRKTFPKSDEIWDLLSKHIKLKMNVPTTREDAANFFADKSCFFLFSAVKLPQQTEYSQTINGLRYTLRVDNNKLYVTENNKKHFPLTSKKIDSIRNALKNMLIESFSVREQELFDEVPTQYILYKPKKEEICQTIISSKNISALRFLEEIIIKDKLDPNYAVYCETIKKITTLISSSKINALLTGFIDEQNKNASFITRILNWILTRKEVKNITGKGNSEKAQITNLSRVFTPAAEANTSVIETAVNILRSSGKDREISKILMSNATNSEKVFQILRLSTAISGKSRAYICLNNESKEEFLKMLKTF